ncbi:hypothetical protein [Nocardioides houyundeii]|uniref:hypothetical protein n=1 Tax=Nocardioides houyundeii TaxID=2045452 RepID=UPI000C75D3FA|nr:hypothetical protein [Nocardioides houyundeii]
MPVSRKYAVIERERRYLVRTLPGPVTSVREIEDRYVTGTRMRLREVRAADGTVVRKRRHLVSRDGVVVAVDELEDGTLLAEIDDAETPPGPVPGWLDVIADVSGDEAWTGVGLAR